MFKIHWNCNFVGFFLHNPFWLYLVFWHFWAYIFNFLKYFLWLRITYEGSVPEMRIWSKSLIKSDLKLCIQISRSLFLNSNEYLVSPLVFMDQRMSTVVFCCRRHSDSTLVRLYLHRKHVYSVYSERRHHVAYTCICKAQFASVSFIQRHFVMKAVM